MKPKPSKKRILILGQPKSGKVSLIKALTSSFPDDLHENSTSHAGLTHSITLTTRYYSYDVGIWIDEIPLEDSSKWLNEYLSEEATPVLQSLAAIIFTIDNSTGKPEEILDIAKSLNERGEEVEWDGTCVIVEKKSSSTQVSTNMPVLCEEHMWEYIDLNQTGKNEFGDKLGLERVVEVLHTCNWTSDSLDDNESLGSLQDAELDFELDAFRDEDAEDGGSEQDVEYMERMMTMLLHAREMGEGMPLEERKQWAQRTINTLASKLS